MFTINKAVFNMSKATIEYITEKVSPYRVITVKIERCKACPLNSNNKEALFYCNNYCNKRYMIVTLINKKTFFCEKKYKLRKSSVAKTYYSNTNLNLPNKKEMYIEYNRFSLSQIKQCILYYYLANSKGIIQSVSKRSLARSLGCTVKTVENNNRVFTEHNLFEIKRDCAGSIYVKIKDFNKQHMEKGTGYMPIPTAILKAILSVKKLNVNALRLLLRSLKNYDYNAKKNHDTVFSLRELKDFLSSTAYNIKSLKKLIDSITDNFKDFVYTKFRNSKEIIFSFVKDVVHGSTYRKALLKKNRNILSECIKDFNIMDFVSIDVSNNEVLANLTDLSLEYGTSLVTMVLGNIYKPKHSIENIGAYCRDELKRYIDDNKACIDLI